MRLVLPMLMTLVSACSTVSLGASSEAGCNATAPFVDALADALLVDGGPQSLVAGENLIATIDAWCAP